MGKKGSSANKKGPMSLHSRVQHAPSITLREESNGKQKKPLSVKSMLKFDHIKNLALWAGIEASIPSLSAFFGHRLAATAEALDVPPDPSLFSCQRCESILRPGYNCTVRIQKNKTKARKRCKKSNLRMKNSVIYRCHACSHQNLMRGTPQGYMKELYPPKVKLIDRLDPMKLTIEMNSKPTIFTECRDRNVKMDAITPDIEENAPSIHAPPDIEEDSPSIHAPPDIEEDSPSIHAPPDIEEDSPSIHAPATPATTVTTLLDSKRRKRNRPGAKKAAESESSFIVADANSTCTSNKRKRKSWTSLKEIAVRNEQEHRHGISKLAIPFVL